MIRGLYTATQGMAYEAMRMDLIANNLANVSTPGYKQNRIGIQSFETIYERLFVQDLTSEETPDIYEPPTIIYAEYATDFSQGTLRHTEAPLDAALKGPGFFVVQHPDGSLRYTRDGHFQMDANRQLVTLLGWPVLGQNGPIQLGDGRVEIDSQGNLHQDNLLIDTLRVEDIPQVAELTREGNNLFLIPSGAGGATPANMEVCQGYLEQSNVDVMREMVDMITALRNYESYQKAIQSIDTSVTQVNQVASV